MINRIKFLCILLLTYRVSCERCVTYDFEESFDESFNSVFGMCENMGASGEWTTGSYSTIPMIPPDDASASFIRPSSVMSCTSSFNFTISSESVLILNAFMYTNSMTDQLNIFVNELVDSGSDVQVGQLTLTPILNNFETGWNQFNISIGGTGSYDGYITLMAQAFEESVLLIDSFRYIPSFLDEEECIIYKQESGESEETTENSNTTLSTPLTTESGATEENDNSTITTPSYTDNTSSEVTEEENNSTITTSSNTEFTTLISTERTEETTICTDSGEEDDDTTTMSSFNEESTPSMTTNGNSSEIDPSTSEEDNSGYEDNTEPPDNETQNEFNFWNAFTIAMVVVLSLIALALISLCCYEYGKHKAQDRLPFMYEESDLSVPQMVPRVTKVYPDVNNIYS